jgi:GT2 family glycosyltransferase
MKLSFIILEYNSLKEVANCIASIKDLRLDVDYEVIVSSNSEYDEPRRRVIERENPEVRFLFNERNGGFGYGMNEGMKVAKGDYYVLCNCDVRFLPGHSVSEFLSFFKEHRVGICGPRIIDEQGRLQDSCRHFVTVRRFVERHIKRILQRKEIVLNARFDYSRIQYVDCVIGACMIINRQVIETIGGFDEHYFLYSEDMDLCTQSWQAGFPVVYYPKLTVEYKGTRSARHSRYYAKVFMRSQWRYWRKWGFFFGYPSTMEGYIDEIS